MVMGAYKVLYSIDYFSFDVVMPCGRENYKCFELFYQFSPFDT